MLAWVMGGGGSRGALQVGAMRALTEAGIKPDILIGTSVGALNALYFADHPTLAGIEQLQAIWLELDARQIFAGSPGSVLWHAVSGKSSLYQNQNLRRIAEHHIPATYFNELQLPAFAVATEMNTGQAVVFGDQPDDRLLDGLMSSLAIPPLLPPWIVGGRSYIDGAYAANLPIRQALERGATEIVALSLSGSSMEAATSQSALKALNHSIDLLMMRQVKQDIEYGKQALDTSFQLIDLHIEDYLPITDFSRTAQLIEAGYALTSANLSVDYRRQPARVWGLQRLLGTDFGTDTFGETRLGVQISGTMDNSKDTVGEAGAA